MKERRDNKINGQPKIFDNSDDEYRVANEA